MIRGEEEGGQEEEEVTRETPVRSSRRGGETLDEEEGYQEEGEEEVTSLHAGWGVAASHLHASGRGQPPSRVCLNDLCDLSGLQTARTDTRALRLAGDHDPHRHEIRHPAPPRELVGVADRVTDRRTLRTDIASLSHECSLNVEDPQGDEFVV